MLLLTTLLNAKRVSFKNGTVTIAGHLHLPEGFSESGNYAAIVVAHPSGGVKEQTAGLCRTGEPLLVYEPSVSPHCWSGYGFR